LAKLIKLNDSTYRLLAERGKWAGSMDDIVRRLITEADRIHKNQASFGERSS
jgi:hypothetical protein